MKKPTVCATSKNLSFGLRPETISYNKNITWPPSNAGIGSKLRTANIIDKKAVIFQNVSQLQVSGKISKMALKYQTPLKRNLIMMVSNVALTFGSLMKMVMKAWFVHREMIPTVRDSTNCEVGHQCWEIHLKILMLAHVTLREQRLPICLVGNLGSCTKLETMNLSLKHLHYLNDKQSLLFIEKTHKQC